jgi:spore coat protein A, manganese oxidase
MIEMNKFTRRDFIKRTAVAGAGVALFTKFAVPSARAINTSPGLQKWIQPLRGLNYPTGHILGALGYPNDPNGIPVAGGMADPVFANTTMYQIGVQEYSDTLHPALGPTKLWGYVDLTRPIPRHLGGIVVGLRGQANRMRFTNNLPARHILPVDIGLPGASQAQNRIAVHIHGGLVPWICDGGPFDWWTPGCESYATGLSFLNGPGGVLDNIPGNLMVPGQADYFYPNDQSTRLMWYHDHAFGITRLNAYAGVASGYLLVDPVDLGAGSRLTANVPPLADLIPLVWQEKSFVSATTPVTDPTWADITRPDVQSIGSLWYEHTYNPKIWKRKAAGAIATPDPSIIPEFFGDTMLCNGSVYPKLTVQPKRYRFMFLNATNARFLNINTFVANPANPDGIDLNATTQFPANPAGPPMYQIGSEGGYLAKEVKFTTSAATAFNPATVKGNMILGPAERADVIIDFSAFAGQDIILYGDAPAPFPGGAPTNDYYLGNAANPVIPVAGFGPDTRQLLRISVAAGTPQAPPAPLPNGDVFLKSSNLLDPPALASVPIPAGTLTPATVIPPLVAPPGTPVRKLTLNEAFDRYGRLIQLLGTTTPQPAGGFGMAYTDPPTENVAAGATEVWQIFNTTADTHPMHFHLVNAQVLSRQPFGMVLGVPTPTKPKQLRGPDANELGWKETIKMHPGEVINILMKFDLPATPFVVPPSPRTGGNEYVWHCHILEHEEHDMMRPLVVT